MALVGRLHRRLPRRDRGGVRGDAAAGGGRGLRLRLHVQVFVRGRAPRPPPCRARSPSRSRPSGWRGCRTGWPPTPAPSAPPASASRLPVLLEKRGRQDGQLIGRSPYLQAVWTEAPEALLGQIVDIEIESVGPNSLSGRLSNSTGPSSGKAPPLHSLHPERVEGPGDARRWSGLILRQAQDEADCEAGVSTLFRPAAETAA